MNLRCLCEVGTFLSVSYVDTDKILESWSRELEEDADTQNLYSTNCWPHFQREK